MYGFFILLLGVAAATFLTKVYKTFSGNSKINAGYFMVLVIVCSASAYFGIEITDEIHSNRLQQTIQTNSEKFNSQGDVTFYAGFLTEIQQDENTTFQRFQFKGALAGRDRFIEFWIDAVKPNKAPKPMQSYMQAKASLFEIKTTQIGLEPAYMVFIPTYSNYKNYHGITQNIAPETYYREYYPEIPSHIPVENIIIFNLSGVTASVVGYSQLATEGYGWFRAETSLEIPVLNK